MIIKTKQNKATLYGRILVIVILVRLLTLTPFSSTEYYIYCTALLVIVLTGLKLKVAKINSDPSFLELNYKNILWGKTVKYESAGLEITIEEGTKFVNGSKKNLVIKQSGKIIEQLNLSYFDTTDYEQLLTEAKETN